MVFALINFLNGQQIIYPLSWMISKIWYTGIKKKTRQALIGLPCMR